jgi:hypothetical protein
VPDPEWSRRRTVVEPYRELHREKPERLVGHLPVEALDDLLGGRELAGERVLVEPLRDVLQERLAVVLPLPDLAQVVGEAPALGAPARIAAGSFPPSRVLRRGHAADGAGVGRWALRVGRALAGLNVLLFITHAFAPHSGQTPLRNAAPTPSSSSPHQDRVGPRWPVLGILAVLYEQPDQSQTTV